MHQNMKNKLTSNYTEGRLILHCFLMGSRMIRVRVLQDSRLPKQV